MNQSIVLTIISPDHPGIIQTVSEALKNHGGNWIQSSMSSLAGQFAGILLVSVPEKHTRACLKELKELESQGMHIIATVAGDEKPAEIFSEYSLALVGNDQPGIVNTVTQLLAKRNISVSELETEVQSGSMSGGTIFRAHAKLQIPELTDINDLEAEIEDLANDLMVDINLEK